MIENLNRNIFDLPANLNKVKKQLAESMELIAVTHETNEVIDIIFPINIYLLISFVKIK